MVPIFIVGAVLPVVTCELAAVKVMPMVMLGAVEDEVTCEPVIATVVGVAPAACSKAVPSNAVDSKAAAMT